MGDVATTGRSLSRRQAQVILDLEWRGEKTLTLAGLAAVLGGSEAYARRLAHGLVRKGWLERLRPGLFRLIPADRGPEGVADTNPLAVGAVLVRPYFFSFGTACTHHGFTEQTFSEIYIACQRRHRPLNVRQNRYVFVDVSADRFFGFSEVSVLGEIVQMATRERALLDAIDRPRFAGGVGEVSRMVSRASGRLDWRQTVDFLSRWRESALVQRLGYFLDLHGIEIPQRHRATLRRLVRPGSKVHLGPRNRWGTAGKLASPWNIIENVPRDVLVEKGEGKKRRVTFDLRGRKP